MLLDDWTLTLGIGPFISVARVFIEMARVFTGMACVFTGSLNLRLSLPYSITHHTASSVNPTHFCSLLDVLFSEAHITDSQLRSDFIYLSHSFSDDPGWLLSSRTIPLLQPRHIRTRSLRIKARLNTLLKKQWSVRIQEKPMEALLALV